MTPKPTLPLREPTTSRRDFLRKSGLLAAALGVAQTEWVGRALLPEVRAEGADPLRDTLNGLIVFVVPGPDAFSVQQGVSTPEPGGIEANITEALILALDQLLPFVLNFSTVVAGILNQGAQALNPSVAGPFASPSNADLLACISIKAPAFAAPYCHPRTASYHEICRRKENRSASNVMLTTLRSTLSGRQSLDIRWAKLLRAAVSCGPAEIC